MYSYSLVIPLYNSQEHLQNFSEKLADFMSNNPSYTNKIELILVVDGGSLDYTNELVFIKEKLSSVETAVYGSEQNKGQLNATTFGLLTAKGNRIITLDVDYYMIADIFNIILQEESDELILYELKEENKPLLRKIGGEVNHRIYTMFFKSKISRGSSLRSLTNKYLGMIENRLKSNFQLLDNILIANTTNIKWKQLNTVYSKSSYSTWQLAKLLFSNLSIRVTKKQSVVKPYKRIDK